MLTRPLAYRRRPAKTGPTPEVRRDVIARCKGRCERCGGSLEGGFNVHHRRPRAMGGTVRPESNGHANLAVLDLSCHREVEADRAQAFGDGWLLSQGTDPAKAPVLLHRQRWVYLGVGYTEAPEVA